MITPTGNVSAEEAAAAPPTLGIRPRDWMRELGVGKHGLAILIRDHGHPAPIALGARSKLFVRAELNAWREERKAARDAAAAWRGGAATALLWFVVIRQLGPHEFTVAIKPPLASGGGGSRTHAAKHRAFGKARTWWSEHRLPCRDLTVGANDRGHREE